MYDFFSKGRAPITVVALVVGIAGIARADEVRVAGDTLGRFNAQPYLPTNSLFDLVYTNSTFDNTTVGGLLDLGGNPTPGTNFNNLGSFALGLADQNYSGNSFQLFVSFSAPVTIVGGSTTFFNDVLTGSVLGGLGGVFIDFDNTPQTFNFSNETAAGSFTMFVNDVSIAPGQAASLTGHISGFQAVVPEPSILIALACGGIGFLRRRRKTV
jgi:hypothetical protein